MQKIGLIGHPIEHSLSPALFRERYGDDSGYVYDLIRTADFSEAVSIFKKDYLAVNVTAPFKEKAFAVADVCDAPSEMARALNLLVKEDSRIVGYNTDVTAVKEILADILHEAGTAFAERPPQVLVIGMGGAGKAAAAAALLSGATVHLCNRTPGKIRNFLDHLGSVSPASLSRIGRVADLSGLDNLVAEADILLYTLPEISRSLSVQDGKKRWFLEANYRAPLFDAHTAAEAGFIYIDGLKWLRLQADATYRIVVR